MDSIERALERCTKCGLCLAVCPTYLVDRIEHQSPRGRLRTMALLRSDGDGLDLTSLWSCLACGLCEEPCPTGVRYLDAYEHARLHWLSDSIPELHRG